VIPERFVNANLAGTEARPTILSSFFLIRLDAFQASGGADTWNPTPETFSTSEY